MPVIRRLLYIVVLCTAAVWLFGYFVFSSPPHRYAEVSPQQKAEAQAYLDRNLQRLPSGWQWGSFEAEPGIMLRTGQLAGEAGKGTVIIVPGYTAPLELYAGEIVAFSRAGFSVAGMEYRGQGKSWRPLENPEKGHVQDYALLTQDLAGYITELKEKQNGPIYVYAESMGGHIALRTAGERQPDVQAYALVAPMVQIRTSPFPYFVARVASGFYSLTGLGENFAPGRGPFSPDSVKFGKPSDCTAYPEKAYLLGAMFMIDETLRVLGPTNQWVHATIGSTDLITSTNFLRQIDKPVLMFTAGDDRFVSTEAAQAVCRDLSLCSEIHYPKSRHCMKSETDEVREAIHQQTLDFFNSLRE